VVAVRKENAAESLLHHSSDPSPAARPAADPAHGRLRIGK
jgi:hypothetical protein